MSDNSSPLFPVTLTDVQSKISFELELTLHYTDSSLNKSIILKPRTKYDIVYLASGELHRVIGFLTGITKVICEADDYGSAPKYEWILQIDASCDCESIVIKMKTSQIRAIKAFVKYADESTVISSATNNGGIVSGTVTGMKIKNAVIDDKGNITQGDVTYGKIGTTDVTITGGICYGNNPNGNPITVVGATTTMGTIVAGKITQGTIPGTYITDPNTGITTVDIINGCVIDNTTIKDCSTTAGKVIDATINPSTVDGGTRSGDIVTYGATVVGGIARDGVTTGGSLSGGTATGTINGVQYTITNGTTTGGTTTGAIITGGVVTGGTIIGGTTIGATITGGVATGGITVGGITTGGDIKPGSATIAGITNSVSPESIGIYNPNQGQGGNITPGQGGTVIPGQGGTVIPDPNSTDPYFDGDYFIIFDNSRTGVGSNLSTVKL